MDKFTTGPEFARQLGVKNPPSKDTKPKVIKPEPEVERELSLEEVKEVIRKKVEAENLEKEKVHHSFLDPFNNAQEDHIRGHEAANRSTREEDGLYLREAFGRHDADSEEGRLVREAFEQHEASSQNCFAENPDGYKVPLQKLKSLEEKKAKDDGVKPAEGSRRYGAWSDSF